MIDNQINNQLSRYFNRSAESEREDSVSETIRRLKAGRDAISGKAETKESEAGEAADAAGPESGDRLELSGKGGRTRTAESYDEKLSPEERRQRELKAILDRINSEEGSKSRNVATASPAPAPAAEAASGAAATDLASRLGLPSNLSGFLNDLPLFNEFKTGLMDAFKSMDKASLGSISAQYELNVSSMQWVSNAAGGFEYQETSFSLKLNLDYVKAAAGGAGKGQAMADDLGQANDFAQLLDILRNGSASQASGAGKTAPSPEDFLSSLKDYFSPEKTAGRIVDFATSFFPLSQAFKRGGDTEEARGEFAETMRQAIQKGFDQAMGVLGKVPRNVQDGIDKTHELTFKGIDDFIKNGLDRQKEANGLYASLEQWNLSFEVNYSQKTVSGSLYGKEPESLASRAGQNWEA